MPIEMKLHDNTSEIQTVPKSDVISDKRIEFLLKEEINNRIAADKELEEQIKAIVPGACYLVIDEKENGSIEISILDKDRKLLDTKIITLTRKLVKEVEVDYDNSEIIFIHYDDSVLTCNISDITTAITNEIIRATNRENEIELALGLEITRATNAEEALGSRIDDLDLAEVGESGSYIKFVSQADGQVSATAQAFDTDVLNESDDNAPTTKAVKDYVDVYGGKIDSISIDGNELPITNKNVDIPTVRTDNDDQELSSEQKTNAKTNLDLENVDNTSDLNKPISTATQAALDLKANDNEVVHLAGNETITGEKTFTVNLTTSTLTPRTTGRNIGGSVTRYASVFANYGDFATATFTPKIKYHSSDTYGLDVPDTSSLTENKTIATTENITDAINSLDVASVGEDGYYLKTILETDGLITATKEQFDRQIDNSSSHNNVPSSQAVREFVNSSIATETANFRGTFNIKDLPLESGTTPTHEEVAEALALVIPFATNNDYCYVWIPDEVTPTQAIEYDKYKYTVARESGEVTGWGFEFALNNSSFTAAQWAAINSGINALKVADMALQSGNNTFTGTNKFSNGVYIGTGTKRLYDDGPGIKTSVSLQVQGDVFPTSNDSKSLGWRHFNWSTLYLSGPIKNGNKNGDYGIILPDTTSWSAHKTIATEDEISELSSNKADKVIATESGEVIDGMLAGLDSTGNLTNSGVAIDDVVTLSGDQTITGNKTINGFTTLNGTTRVNTFRPHNDNTFDLGSSIYKWKDGYFAGQVYAQNTYNVINATDIVNNTLTEAQYAIFTNGKFTRIEGSLFGYNNPVFMSPSDEDTNNLYGILFYNRSVSTYRIQKNNRQILETSTLNIPFLKGKTVPNFPSSTGTFINKMVNGAWSWIEDTSEHDLSLKANKVVAQESGEIIDGNLAGLDADGDLTNSDIAIDDVALKSANNAFTGNNTFEGIVNGSETYGFRVGFANSTKYTFTASAFRGPGLDLGNSSNKWKDLYLSGKANLGNATLYEYSNNLLLDLNNTARYLFASTTFQPNGSNNSNKIDLGGTGRTWKNLYLSGNLSDGTNSITISNIQEKVQVKRYI